MLHGQILILYNWRPYLLITPCIYALSNKRRNMTEPVLK